MHHQAYHIVVDLDDDRQIICNPTQPNRILEALVAAGHMAYWTFSCSISPELEYVIHVYDGLSSVIPQGENLETINRLALACAVSD